MEKLQKRLSKSVALIISKLQQLLPVVFPAAWNPLLWDLPAELQRVLTEDILRKSLNLLQKQLIPGQEKLMTGGF